jgi:hypothetical protein
MILDAQSLFNLVAGSVMALIGYVASQVWTAVKELQSDVREIEVNLPKEYVQKVDMDRRMEHIEDMFQRIYDKLDGKVDKR